MSKLYRNGLFGLALVILSQACMGPDPVPLETLMANLKGSVTVEKELMPYQLTAQYVPDWLRARKSWGADGDPESFQALRDQHDKTLHFVLSVSPSDQLNAAEKAVGDLVNYQPDQATFSHYIHRYTYGMDDYIYLVLDDELKLPVTQYHLERNWGIGYTNSFLLVFPTQVQDRNVRDADKVELVIQNLKDGMPELRFEFSGNPVADADFSSEYLLECFKTKQTEPKS